MVMVMTFVMIFAILAALTFGFAIGRIWQIRRDELARRHGALFRSETRQRTRTNLMVFLRPVVMRDGEATTAAKSYVVILSAAKDL